MNMAGLLTTCTMHRLCVSLSLLVCVILPVISASAILMLPLAGEGSHYYVMDSIAKELLARGHQVTMLLNGNYKDSVQHQGPKHPQPLVHFEFFKQNFTQSEIYDFNRNMTNAGLEGRFMEFMMEISLESSLLMDKQMQECRNIFDDKDLITKLQNSNFDLALVDNNIECPVPQYLHKQFGVPYAVVVPTITVPVPQYIGNRFPLNPSYMPPLFSGLNDDPSFSNRMFILMYTIINGVLFSSMSSPFAELSSDYGMPDVSLTFSDAEMWMINTHSVFDYPMPFLPNQVAVGGLTTKSPTPLDHEWEEFLQSAGPDGVVLFSMGTYASGIKEDIAAMFAGAFAQLPQKVIWKLNGAPPVAKLTPNIKVVDWVPQNDLLAHPQIKAFVYHCGMNGIWEAVYHGVPMVAVPLFGDQSDNAQRLVSRGMGVQVDITTLTSDKLAQAIRTVIDDKSYKINASKMSAIFRDKSRAPPELAADWVEYLIRHKGAKHLRSAALDLNFYQYMLLDVILTLLAAVIVALVLVICSCKLFFRGCRKMCGASDKVKRE